MNTRPLVSVIDDDESVRESLPSFAEGFGFVVRASPRSRGIFGLGQVLQSKCLILDITMPGMSGPDSWKN